jgi:creatinine amidohydrolase
MRLEEYRWPELPKASGRVFVVPLGSLEQHGPHLPLGTDSMIVSKVADAVDVGLDHMVVTLPVMWLGHSPHHRRFGCVSLDLIPYVQMIQGMCRSLVALGARKIFLLNGHGGNDIPCKAALRELKSEFADRRDLYIVYATYWNLAAEEFTEIRESPKGGMGHACEMETSIMLAVHKDLVAPEPYLGGGPYRERPQRRIDMLASQPYYVVNDFDELSHNGVIGLPEYAEPEKGRRFLDAAAKGAADFIRDFATWKYQERAPEAAE